MSLSKRLLLETIDQDRLEIDKEYYERMNQIKCLNYEQERHDRLAFEECMCRKRNITYG
jgi:hypothetical protein